MRGYRVKQRSMRFAARLWVRLHLGWRRYCCSCGLLCVLAMWQMPVAEAMRAVQYTRLVNGMQVLVVPIPSMPAVLTSVWYKVGSSYEHNGITGISHVLEHLMFQGSKHYPGQIFNQKIAAAGGSHNAFTTRDYTVFFEKTPASDVAAVLDMEADRMQQLNFDQKTFSNEISVVKEERHLTLGDNPQALTMERFYATAFTNNPYHNPIIGWSTDIDALNMQEVQDWYHAWYTPNNAVLVMVGDIDLQRLLPMLQHNFAKLKGHKLLQIKPRQEVEGLGSRALHVHWPAQQPWFVAGYTVPSFLTLPVHQRWKAYALLLLANILAGGQSSRLQQLVDVAQQATTVSATYNPYALYQTLFMLSATPNAGVALDDLQAAVVSKLDEVQHHLVSVDELNKVKMQVVANHVYAQDSLMQQAVYYGRLLALGLPWKMQENFVLRMQEITPQQVRQVAQEYFNSRHLTTAYLHPASS